MFINMCLFRLKSRTYIYVIRYELEHLVFQGVYIRVSSCIRNNLILGWIMYNHMITWQT